LTTLGTFVLLEIVLCFIPGPAVMAVVSSALTGRSRAGMATAFGILTGNLVYFLVSALGITSILLASHAAFTLLKWCGAAYLAYLGVRAISAGVTASHDSSVEVPGLPSHVRGWWSGTVVQLSNPKAIVFFAAILPQFIDPRGDVVLQESILGTTSLAVEFVVLSMYVWSAERVRSRGVSLVAQTWAQRVGGIIMLGVAASVARASV
jgi:threonine/homoserine/homoserine lactone efflux protein